MENLLATISTALPNLNKSEKKVAAVILDDPEASTQSSIATLATKAKVSEPSVNRFCKRFGASGFPDFKLKLAKSLVSGVRYVSSAVELEDSSDEFTPKIFNNSIHALSLVRDSINPALVARVVDQLVQARRIYFFGLGTSAAVATDAEYKFFRFNTPVSSHHDPLMQRMLASAGGVGDLFFCISHTGRTKTLIETAQLARENGATVVGLTAPNSALSQACQWALELDVPEDTDEYLPMTSRIVHLVVLDVLATGVTLRKGEEFLPHLARIKNSLKPTRLSQD
ncbi:Phosphogluconate repressor HexR, RpiR family [Aequoribacter fuscus]|jgi:RpiR family carbohydrate utilization transcriptional regulator|uniref:Phosphogluconate repressor HexR, RpiR family n=1 Tax=Aequoribacter fuscus TaxID=2518989 RepID=F3L363_9GAMM|nr:transcriptional regulator HexR [Aequoribacter fuscus]EGG29214.1 Phosphogluconate repressor HexR, RpiR family [Aequoribacter fuscus]QHJ88439.1 transcriptional regulator HexR [Aequoribacter fuscus]